MGERSFLSFCLLPFLSEGEGAGAGASGGGRSRGRGKKHWPGSRGKV